MVRYLMEAENLGEKEASLIWQNHVDAKILLRAQDEKESVCSKEPL